MNEKLDRLEKMVKKLDGLVEKAEKQVSIVEESNQRSMVAFTEIMLFRNDFEEKLEQIKTREVDFDKMERNLLKKINDVKPWYQRFALIAWGVVFFIIFILIIV